MRLDNFDESFFLIRKLRQWLQIFHDFFLISRANFNEVVFKNSIFSTRKKIVNRNLIEDWT